MGAPAAAPAPKSKAKAAPAAPAATGYTAEQLAAYEALGMEPPPLDEPPF
jgi:hypothetical protein